MRAGVASHSEADLLAMKNARVDRWLPAQSGKAAVPLVEVGRRGRSRGVEDPGVREIARSRPSAKSGVKEIFFSFSPWARRRRARPLR